MIPFQSSSNIAPLTAQKSLEETVAQAPANMKTTDFSDSHTTLTYMSEDEDSFVWSETGGVDLLNACSPTRTPKDETRILILTEEESDQTTETSSTALSQLEQQQQRLRERMDELAAQERSIRKHCRVHSNRATVRFDAGNAPGAVLSLNKLYTAKLEQSRTFKALAYLRRIEGEMHDRILQAQNGQTPQSIDPKFTEFEAKVQAILRPDEDAEEELQDKLLEDEELPQDLKNLHSLHQKNSSSFTKKNGANRAKMMMRPRPLLLSALREEGYSSRSLQSVREENISSRSLQSIEEMGNGGSSLSLGRAQQLVTEHSSRSLLDSVTKPSTSGGDKKKKRRKSPKRTDII